jgi:hypothetical protein
MDRMHAEAAPPRGALNFVVSLTFAGAAVLFVLHFVYVYAEWENGRLADVLWGLWGLYFPAILSFGAWRARPRPGRSGRFHAFLMLAFLQAFLLAVGFGATLVTPRDELVPATGYGLLAAVAAAPILGVAAIFLANRRGWRIGWLAAGELGGAATLAAYFLLLG